MKKTGVMRSIDELGRIVIPMEIRKQLNIQSGDNIEIIVNGQEICLKKHSKSENLREVVKSYIKLLSDALHKDVAFFDEESILSSNNDLLINMPICSKLYELLQQGKAQDINCLINENYNYYASYIVPVNVQNELVGAGILINDNPSELDKKILEFAAGLFNEQIILQSSGVKK